MGTDSKQLASELEQRGWHSPTRIERGWLVFRRLIHPLGFHKRVRAFTWNEEIERMIDLGMMCMFCGR